MSTEFDISSSESVYVHLSHDEWKKRASHTPLPLTSEDIRALSSLGDPIDLAEADAVYRPLSALVHMYVEQNIQLHSLTSEFLGLKEKRTPYVIGIAGSVAVGKSTTARLLKELLSRWPQTPHVELVTTDGFLYPNAVLEKNGISHRKGFPESYDRAALVDFVKRVKSGEELVRAPVYSHLTYDLVPGQWQEVHHPDILILEGLNVLQPPPLTGRELVAVSDFFDLSIYVDARESDIRQWYLDRILRLRDIAFNREESYFHRFSRIPKEEMVTHALNIWETINHPNLVENIEPTRSRADIVIHKGSNHMVEHVTLRKL